MRRFSRPLAAGFLGLALLLGAGCSDSGGPTTATDETQAPREQQPVQTPVGTAPAGSVVPNRPTGELSTSELVKLAEPAIVRIQTNGGVGTGFVVDPEGYIMTNNHVILGGTGRPATNIRVTLSDGTVLAASVVGTDEKTDMAVLKVEQSGLTALSFADLDQVEIGQDVVAIGYALDLGRGEGPSFSVTRGIVSQKNRAINEDSPSAIIGAVQTDAAINHGNSGGPLLNLNGEVVGINTALAPDGDGGIALGIGFAVGSDIARAVYEEILENGRVDRGLLGVNGFETLRPARARELGLPEDATGLTLGTVPAAGPVGSAGLTSGDVITKLADIDVHNDTDLMVALIKHGPGETVTVEYYRDGSKRSAEVTLGTPS